MCFNNFNWEAEDGRSVHGVSKLKELSGEVYGFGIMTVL